MTTFKLETAGPFGLCRLADPGVMDNFGILPGQMIRMHSRLPEKVSPRLLVVAAFAAVYIFWGSTYIAIAIAIESTPPFLMAGLRFFAAGAILYMWCLARGQRTPGMASIGRSALAGILMLFCGTTALIWAEQYLPAGLCSIVVAATPFWFVILDRKNWKTNFSNRLITGGIALGLAGIVMLSLSRGSINLAHNRNQFTSFLVLTGGTVLWSVGSLYSKYSATSGSTSIKASFQMMAAGLFALLISVVSGEYGRFSWNQVTLHSVEAMLYLVTFGSLVGYIAYVWLLDVRPPAIVGTYAYVNPAIALFLGWLILHEHFRVTQLFSLAIILGGVLLINFSKYRKLR